MRGRSRLPGTVALGAGAPLAGHELAQPGARASLAGRRQVEDLLLGVGHEARLPEQLQVLADVAAGGEVAADVLLGAFLDQRLEKGPAHLGRHGSIRGVELGDYPVVAVWLLDGAAAADQLPIALRDEVHRGGTQREPGGNEGGQADPWARGGRGGNTQASPVGVAGRVRTMRQVDERLPVGQARGSDGSGLGGHARWPAAVPTISTRRRCSRRSAVSSGWKAVASTLPWRTAMGCPSASTASTSALGPTRLTTGARMKTPCSGSSPIAGIE